MDYSSSTNKIIADISECSYPKNFIEYVASIVQKISRSTKQVAFFKVNTKDNFTNSKIIACKYPLEVNLKGKNYIVPIIIYIPSKFPYEVPTIYIEKQPNITINSKNVHVDPTTFKVVVPSLLSWNPQISDIMFVIQDVQNSFSEYFPYYKTVTQVTNPLPLNTSQAGLSSSQALGNSGFQSNSTDFQNTGFQNTAIKQNPTNFQNTGFQANPIGFQNSGFQANQTSFQNTGFQNNGFQGTGGNQPVNNPTLNSSFASTNQSFYGQPQQKTSNAFATGSVGWNSQGQTNQSLIQPTSIKTIIPQEKIEEESKKLLTITIQDQLLGKILTEVNRVKQQEQSLLNYKTEFSEHIESVNKILSSNDEVFSKVESKGNSLKEEMASLQQYLQENVNEEITSANFRNFIQWTKDEEQLMKVISLEATLEDSTAIFKKFLEREGGDLELLIKLVRKISVEKFHLRYVREKLIQKINK